MSGAPHAPVHHCPFCGGAVDPLQAHTRDGGCPSLSCRVRAREAFEAESVERLERRRAAAVRHLGSRGVDPVDDRWAIVPRNDAAEVTLEPHLAADFRRHLQRTVAESRPPNRATPGASSSMDTAPAPDQRAALARGCATCRGWCCRRGGTHAFLDRASIERVRSDNPAWSEEQIVTAYLDHIGSTHLAGGCLFQGPQGCRLPTRLRSDTCNDWWCPDLVATRDRWERDELDPAETTFVPVPTRPGPDDADDGGRTP